MQPTTSALGVSPVVHVLDDDDVMCDLIAELARSIGAEARTYARAEEFFTQYRAHPIECLVADVRMPGLSGLDVQRQLRDTGVDMPMIFVTGYGDVTTAVEAMRAGALDYLQKPFSRDALKEKLETAIAKAREGLRKRMEQTAIDARLALLTPKEREVAQRVVAGLSSREIAAEFGLSVRTVENHRARIMEKLRAQSVVDLVHLIAPR